DGARGTDGLGLALADLALGLAFAVRAEEEDDFLAAARGSILPAPVRPGRQCHLPAYLRHESISSTVLCGPDPASSRARGLAPCGFCPVSTSNALPGRRVPGRRPPWERPSGPNESGGANRLRDRPRASAEGAMHASRPGEASRFGEPTFNDAIPAGAFAAERENSRRQTCPSRRTGAFMITNWTKPRVRVHHGLHVCV